MPFVRQNWLVNRRHVLKGLGAAIALPFLDCMRPISASGNVVTVPKRSVFIYLPNGVNTLDYQILQSGADYTFSKILKPLERFRDVLTPISGLHHPNGLGHHHNCQSIWLSGAKIGPTERNSVTVDQLIAEVTASQTRFPSLELSQTGKSISNNHDGINLPAMINPAEVFKRLFEVPEGGVAAERRGLARRTSILDAVLDEAQSFRHRIGYDDRLRMDQYLTSVREIEIRTQRANDWLDVPRPDVRDADRQRITRHISQNETPGEYYRTMYDLMLLAFETDMTRVATFGTGDEGLGLPIPELKIAQTRHALSHHNGDPEQLKRLTQSDIFNIEQFAYFLGRLQETKDSHGPLLDSTVVLFGSGMAYGHSHGNANLPTIVAGGKNAGFKHGLHVDFNDGHFDGYDVDERGNLKTSHYGVCSRPANEKARLSNLLLTLAQSMNVEIDSFADSTREVSEIKS
ncbi:DUF1552 domain-containing protein [Planctomicrobium sp. SH661]|uniref:DUF1552 domain-containing protein n=1 Tax=Planctomicrobium sp. SH661 TaxID=3448124 RepID=UPI003F5BBBF1